MRNVTYSFKQVTQCNMCHADTSSFQILGKRLNQSQGLRPHKKRGITVTIVRCGNCGLIFPDPFPIPAKIEQHYELPPETYWSKEYFSIDESYFQGELSWLRRLKDITPGMKSLDIGAGIGKQMIALNKDGFDAYGLEPSLPFYQRAVDVMGIPVEKIMNTALENADYPENFFDFISFGAVLEHVYDPSDSINKVLNWLKPDGIIHIEVPNAKWLTNKIINVIYKMMGSDYVGNISPMHIPFHLYEFPIESFRCNSEINGYSVRDFGYYICDTYLPKIFDPVIKPYMKRTDTGMQLVVWLTKSPGTS